MTTSEILGKTKLFTQNSKIKKTGKHFGVRLFNFGIPAYKEAGGKIVCPFADDCIKFCYAQKGAYVWSNVNAAFQKRYDATKSDDFVFAAVEELQRNKADYVRIHDSGDFYSPEYLNKWIAIAQLLPQVRFYAYTKSFGLVRSADIPDNMCFIFSTGSKLDFSLNEQEERHAKIFESRERLLEERYVDCSEYDLYATKWFSPDNHNVGLIYH
jgi:hypothetical protein